VTCSSNNWTVFGDAAVCSDIRWSSPLAVVYMLLRVFNCCILNPLTLRLKSQ